MACDTKSVDDITHSTIVREDIINIRSDVHDDTAGSEMENAQSVSKCRRQRKKKTTPLPAGLQRCGGEMQLEAKTERQSIRNSTACFSDYKGKYK